jgi:hypothetical protein
MEVNASLAYVVDPNENEYAYATNDMKISTTSNNYP